MYVKGFISFVCVDIIFVKRSLERHLRPHIMGLRRSSFEGCSSNYSNCLKGLRRKCKKVDFVDIPKGKERERARQEFDY